MDFSAFFLSHLLRYLCKQQGVYALKIVRQCLAFVIEYFGYYSLAEQRLKPVTFLSQVDLKFPFQAVLELEADKFESSNNVQNEPNENDSEPEKVCSIAETLLYLANIRTHLMSLGEDIEAFDSLKKLERIKKDRRISIQTNKYC